MPAVLEQAYTWLAYLPTEWISFPLFSFFPRARLPVVK